MPAIVRDGVNCKAVSGVQDVVSCQGNLPDIAFQVTTIDGSNEELVLKNEDYNIRYIEFQPIELLSSQGIQLLLGDTFLRKYYTEFNFKDRRLDFALRVKKKGDFLFWITLFGGFVLVLGVIGCFLAHWHYGVVLNQNTRDPPFATQLSPEAQREARGIVYSGQFGSTTQYPNDVENSSSRTVPLSAAPISSGRGGYRLSDGQQEGGRGHRLVSGIFGRLGSSGRPTEAQTMREQRERLLSALEQKDVSDV